MSAVALGPGRLRQLIEVVGLVDGPATAAGRREPGYRVDEVARALMLLSRGDVGTGDEHPVEDRARRSYLDFVIGSQTADGQVVERRDEWGLWLGRPGTGDSLGTALWALGTTAGRGRDPGERGRAAGAFSVSAPLRSGSLRALAFAGLGAAEYLRLHSGDAAARALLHDAATAVDGPEAASTGYPGWPWPEARLSYANAVLPDVLMAAGDCFGDPGLVGRGLGLLGWLLDLETATGHLSPTPADGWAPGEPRPGFEQRPTEVSTLADACARAAELTGERRWTHAVELSAAWFDGLNDWGVPLVDPVTGACGDALTRRGRGAGRGAAAALALVSTLQHAERLGGRR